MTRQQEIGEKGEELAREYLRGISYIIKDTNWRFGKDEIDIIAMDKHELVFVEVKTRYHTYLLPPYMAVTKRKQRFMIRAANAYIDKKNYPGESRFDVISIVIYPDKHELEHIKYAFYPSFK
jgi:putative endonuclease